MNNPPGAHAPTPQEDNTMERRDDLTGWICPRCEAALAPWMGRCVCKPAAKEVPPVEDPPPMSLPLMEAVPWLEPATGTSALDDIAVDSLMDDAGGAR